jgi:3-hydroxyisobutyrate dehydrogenase-like beta-hydroxyacid dehydrogenase
MTDPKVDHLRSAATGGPALGWIGAGGRMGFEMAARLLNAGYRLRLYNRTREKIAPLVDRGAQAVDTPAGLAECPIVFITVGGDADFEAVIFGEDGVASGERTPKVLVDLTTVSADVSASVRERLAERRIALLASPVSGNAKVIPAGLLSIVVSGPSDAFERARPFLEQLGRRVTYVGEGERARLVKICHNLYLGMVIQGLVEVTILAEKGGIARADMLEFINTSVMGSRFSQYKTPALVNLDFEPTFTLELLKKDLTLGTDAAEALGVPVPFTKAIIESVQKAIDAGFSGRDFAALIAVRAAEAGIDLKPEGAAVATGLELPAETSSVA